MSGWSSLVDDRGFSLVSVERRIEEKRGEEGGEQRRKGCKEERKGGRDYCIEERRKGKECVCV